MYVLLPTDRQGDKPTDRQKDRQKNKQADRQTARQTHKYRFRQTAMQKKCFNLLYISVLWDLCNIKIEICIISHRFCHAETVIPLATILNLFKPSEHLLASNFAYHRNRQFRISKIAPMSANLLFVVYDCKQATNKDCQQTSSNNIYIKLFLNEEETEIPGCTKPTGLCSLDELGQQLYESIYNCRFDEMCRLGNDDGGSLDHITSWVSGWSGYLIFYISIFMFSFFLIFNFYLIY